MQYFKGGLYGLESEYGSGWRATFTAAEQKYFSRLKLTVSNINKLIEQENSTAEMVLQHLESYANEQKANSVTALEKLLKEYVKSMH
jgi:hypothetical protein